MRVCVGAISLGRGFVRTRTHHTYNIISYGLISPATVALGCNSDRGDSSYIGPLAFHRVWPPVYANAHVECGVRARLNQSQICKLDLYL